MNRPIKVWHLIFALGLMLAYSLTAQTPPVMFFASTSGSTITNCGTPTTPSLCGVGTGWYVWTNATTGWVQIGLAPAAAPVASVTVCNAAGSSCGPAQTGAVTLKIPTTVTIVDNGSTGTLQ